MIKAYQCNTYNEFAKLYQKYIISGSPKVSWDYGFTCISEDGYCSNEAEMMKRYEITIM